MSSTVHQVGRSAVLKFNSVVAVGHRGIDHTTNVWRHGEGTAGQRWTGVVTE